MFPVVNSLELRVKVLGPLVHAHTHYGVYKSVIISLFNAR